MGSGKPQTLLTIGPTAAEAGGDTLHQAAELIAEAFIRDAGPYVDSPVPDSYLGYVQARLEQEFAYAVEGLALIPLEDQRWKQSRRKVAA